MRPTQALTRSKPVLQLGYVANQETGEPNVHVPFRFTLSNNPWRETGFRCGVFATSGGGKSHMLSLFAEELSDIGNGFLFIDPDSEYRSLGDLPRVAVIDYDGDGDIKADGGGKWLETVARLLTSGWGVVWDCSGMSQADQFVEYSVLLNYLFEYQKRSKKLSQLYPFFLIIDEAQIFAPQDGPAFPEARQVTETIARRGRKFGINWVMASQRPGDLIKKVIGMCNVRLIGRLEIPHDFDAVKEYVPRSFSLETFIRLRPGNFFMKVGADINLVRGRQRRTDGTASATPAIEVRQHDLLSSNLDTVLNGFGR